MAFTASSVADEQQSYEEIINQLKELGFKNGLPKKQIQKSDRPLFTWFNSSPPQAENVERAKDFLEKFPKMIRSNSQHRDEVEIAQGDCESLPLKKPSLIFSKTLVAKALVEVPERELLHEQEMQQAGSFRKKKEVQANDPAALTAGDSSSEPEKLGPFEQRLPLAKLSAAKNMPERLARLQTIMQSQKEEILSQAIRQGCSTTDSIYLPQKDVAKMVVAEIIAAEQKSRLAIAQMRERGNRYRAEAKAKK